VGEKLTVQNGTATIDTTLDAAEHAAIRWKLFIYDWGARRRKGWDHNNGPKQQNQKGGRSRLL